MTLESSRWKPAAGNVLVAKQEVEMKLVATPLYSSLGWSIEAVTNLGWRMTARAES